MRVVFFGTPKFSIPSLQMLIDKENVELVGVFCQPDKPIGRQRIITHPPTKKLALEHGIPVFQPPRIRDPEGAEMLRSVKPDLMVTAAYGQILSRENIETPPLGGINVHGSLLPKYRGSAPIQWAVIDGKKETGVTIAYIELKVDSGDVIRQKTLEILPDETSGELFTRISYLGAEALSEAIDTIESGQVVRIKQDESLVTECKMLTKEDGKIDWNWPAQKIHDRVRGVNPWPGAFCLLGEDDVLKIWKTKLVDSISGIRNAQPGEIISADKDGLIVQTGDAAIKIEEIQLSGGKRMDSASFLRGRPLRLGESLR